MELSSMVSVKKNKLRRSKTKMESLMGVGDN